MASVFETLKTVNVNGRTEKKNTGSAELTYLSWPWAWSEIKQRYPEAHYEIWKDQNGRPYTYDPLTGYMVYTTLTIGNETHEMWLPVMDGANKAMKSEPYDYTVKNPNFRYAKWNDEKKQYIDRYGKEQPEFLQKHVEAATMFDINKAIMRCLVKNIAMFGLGLYIFAGEDLPDGEEAEEKELDQYGQEEAYVSGLQSRLNERLGSSQMATPAQEPPQESPQRPPRMATEAQKQMIREGLDEKMLASAIRKYGPHFEKMTAEAAGQALQMIREAKTA